MAHRLRPDASNVVAKLVCYPDTVDGYLLRYPTREQQTMLREAHRAWVRIDKCNDAPGWMMSLQTPQPDVLRVASVLGATVSRLDLAYDWHSLALNNDQLDRWVRAHILLRHRKAAPMRRHKTTMYFEDSAHKPRGDGKAKKPRDLAIYSSLDSKLWSIPSTVHTELRLRNRGARKIGVISPADILQLDPAAVFRKHIRVTSYNANDKADELMRAQLLQERERYVPQDHRHAIGTATDIYRARLRRRIDEAWLRDDAYYRHAQYIHDQFPRIVMKTDYSLVTLPTEFSWGASRVRKERRPQRKGPFDQ